MKKVLISFIALSLLSSAYGLPRHAKRRAEAVPAGYRGHVEHGDADSYLPSEHYEREAARIRAELSNLEGHLSSLPAKIHALKAELAKLEALADLSKKSSVQKTLDHDPIIETPQAHGHGLGHPTGEVEPTYYHTGSY